MPGEAWLTLLQAAHYGGRSWLHALSRLGSAAALVTASAATLKALGVDAAAVSRLHSPDRRLLSRWSEWLAIPGHALIPIGTRGYPARLAEAPDPPLALWTIGADPSLLGAEQVAIVGSRNPTTAGRQTAEAFAAYFSASGLGVTSGLAIGIDAAAHRGALAGPGGTVAVLGCGIDIVYPHINTALAAEIAARGLIVSEYPPGTPARAYRFPKRNRIIAGLTLGTLVIEATRRSGSLITAKLAADYGREVFAMPGSIHNPLSRGCHLLLREGATLVEEGSDVLAEIAPIIDRSALPRMLGPTETSEFDLDPEYAKLVKSLSFHPTQSAELMKAAGLTAAELSSMLLHLEMQGLVEALPGGRYCRLVKRG